MSIRFPAGFYRAKAASSQLGYTNDGKPQIAVEFELLDEEWKGQRITWYGYFTEKSEQRTIQSLQHCGWTGDDIAADPLPGLGSMEVSIEIEIDNYKPDQPRSKVAWVNKAGGVELKKPMDDAQRRQFAASMRQKIAAERAKNGAQPSSATNTKPAEGGDIPF